MSTRPCVLVAEDEAPQREALVASLRRLWPEAELAVCGDGASALEAIAARTPDAAFLDIRMPGADGLAVARAAAACGGAIVFVTAYDAHAVAAFEHGAIDYLLKPLREDALQRALERVRDRLRRAPPVDVDALLRALSAARAPAAPAPLRWITAGLGDSVRLLPVDEVVFFQSDDKYVRVVTADEEALIRLSLRELRERLDPERFWQVHRTSIVRVDAIDRVRRDALGRHGLSLRGRDEVIPVSAAYRHRFRGM